MLFKSVRRCTLGFLIDGQILYGQAQKRSRPGSPPSSRYAAQVFPRCSMAPRMMPSRLSHPLFIDKLLEVLFRHAKRFISARSRRPPHAKAVQTSGSAIASSGQIRRNVMRLNDNRVLAVGYFGTAGGPDLFRRNITRGFAIRFGRAKGHDAGRRVAVSNNSNRNVERLTICSTLNFRKQSRENAWLARCG